MSAADVFAEMLRLEQQRSEDLAAIRARLDQLEGRPDAYTIPRFAEICHCSEKTIRRAIDDDLIRVIYLGDRTTVIPAAELDGHFASERARRQLRSIPGGAA